MIYVVQAGDSLYELARRFEVGVEALRYLNQIPEPVSLVVGQALWIPAGEPPRTGLRVNGFAYPYISPWVMEQTLPALARLSVFSYGFTPEGALLPPVLSDARLREQARRAGVPAAMVLTPLDAEGRFSNRLISSLLGSPQARQRLLAESAEVMAQRGFSELNIDFEYVLPADRDRFSQFVEEAADALKPLGYAVTVDLAPKTSANQRGTLYEGKDYRRLGAAADRALLMTYEWGYKYDPAGYGCASPVPWPPGGSV